MKTEDENEDLKRLVMQIIATGRLQSSFCRDSFRFYQFYKFHRVFSPFMILTFEFRSVLMRETSRVVASCLRQHRRQVECVRPDTRNTNVREVDREIPTTMGSRG